jgi:hypothetical protein
MNGASAGAGGEAPLVYKAWKGNNVSGMPLLPMSLPLCAFFFPSLSSSVAGVAWICAASWSRLELAVPFFLGTGTGLTRVVRRCWDSLVELGKFVCSLLAPNTTVGYSISSLFIS